MCKQFEFHEGAYYLFEYRNCCNGIIYISSAPPISDIYPEQNSQFFNVLLEQINHLRQENENKTCIIQALIDNQNDFQNITKGTQESWNNDFKKNNITDKHAEDHVINISD